MGDSPSAWKSLGRDDYTITVRKIKGEAAVFRGFPCASFEKGIKSIFTETFFGLSWKGV
jgi:hypothetical protein